MRHLLVLLLFGTPWLATLGCGGAPQSAAPSTPEATPEIDPEIAADLELLEGEDTAQVIAAIERLELRDDPAIVEALVGLLEDERPEIARRAWDSLVAFGKADTLAAVVEHRPADLSREELVAKLIEFHFSAIPELGRVLIAGDDEERVIAAVALERSRSYAAAADQIAALADPLPEVRRHSALALGFGRRQEAFDPIVGLLDDDVQAVRVAAVAALGDMKNAEALPHLVARFGAADDELRRAAIGSCKRLRVHLTAAEQATFDELLIAATRDASSQARHVAGVMLAERGGLARIEALAPLLADPDQGVREGVEYALTAQFRKAAAQSGTTVQGALEGMIADGPTASRAAGLRLLAAVRGSAAIPAIEPFLADEDPQLRLTAAILLAGFDVSISKQLLRDLLGQEATGTAAFGELFDPQRPAAPEIAAVAAKSKVAAVRALAAAGLGQLSEPAGFKLLTRLAADRDEAVRLAGVRALAARKDARALPHFVKRLGDGEAVSAAAEDAIRNLPGDKERAVLAALGRKDPRAQAAAARLLKYVGHVDSIKPLIRQLGSKDAGVRDAAVAALEQLTCQSFGADQAAWRKWHKGFSPVRGLCWDQHRENVQ